jgi:tripartite-type tricarboxylate transporter receptor subunit TctC
VFAHGGRSGHGRRDAGPILSFLTDQDHRAAAPGGKRRPHTVATAQPHSFPALRTADWLGVIAPAGAPNEIFNRINEGINRVMNSPEVAKITAGQDVYVVNESPKYFEGAIKSDFVKYGKLIRDIGFATGKGLVKKNQFKREKGSMIGMSC